ncbi:hypothetical protein GHK86_16190 [Acidimicrobiaceae bacterium USS-CC1]|uniref:Uncharacterized protein n=1 Tax=Acidiferrimicrobium australe TaxID=2664430 RepID=A0ABW9QXS5_9ACTN|nr:hypothetical protein [Acidiferrimicrobium australe]
MVELLAHVSSGQLAGHFTEGADMTFGIPIGTLAVAVLLAFFQRKPLPDRRRQPMFPLSGIPQRSYDLAIVNALHKRRRDELVADRDARTAGAERPVGE